MVSIVERVAQVTGVDELALFQMWQECVQLAQERGYGRLDSKTYCIAARMFLEETETDFNLQDIRQMKMMKGYNAHTPTTGVA